MVFFFFFQAEDGIRDLTVTGVQTCALPIYRRGAERWARPGRAHLAFASRRRVARPAAPPGARRAGRERGRGGGGGGRPPRWCRGHGGRNGDGRSYVHAYLAAPRRVDRGRAL